MTCFTCKGDVVKSTTTYMTEYDGCFLIIKPELFTTMP